MTGGQFYKELEKSKNKFAWTINKKNEIRGSLKAKYNKKELSYKKNCFCPITAVTFLTNNLYFNINNAYKAGDKIRLNYRFASQIIDSSDDFYYKSKTRRHLKKVLKLN